MLRLAKDLLEAQKAVEEGCALELVLKQKIDQLEDERKDLMQTFKAEKTALEKRVRELTYKLEVRVEDLEKKEVGTPKRHVFIMKLQMEAA